MEAERRRRAAAARHVAPRGRGCRGVGGAVGAGRGRRGGGGGERVVALAPVAAGGGGAAPSVVGLVPVAAVVAILGDGRDGGVAAVVVVGLAPVVVVVVVVVEGAVPCSRPALVVAGAIAPAAVPALPAPVVPAPPTPVVRLVAVARAVAVSRAGRGVAGVAEVVIATRGGDVRAVTHFADFLFIRCCISNANGAPGVLGETTRTETRISFNRYECGYKNSWQSLRFTPCR